ncbi:metal-dependent hydrolase family protein [Hungatella effluvii]|uniref:metal-dependent hydrolase family protein n=1 Tax=Hungatella effluvii TaxID=1096246 RepID=UPI0022E64CC5|nr:amidohydrolase family protein [Hungatella effluvii]
MARKTYLIHARIIDGVQDTAIEDGIMIFQGGMTRQKGGKEDKILFVGKMEEFPGFPEEVMANDTVVDLTGYTLTPGLYNVHAHLGLTMPYKPYRFDEMGVAYRSLVMLRRACEALNCGITTVRSAGGPDNIDYAIRDAVDNEMMFAARVIPCGALNIAVGGHAWNNYISTMYNGADQFRAAARAELAKGAQFIKIGLTGGAASAHEGMADKQMTDEEIAAVVEVAHGAGKRVAAHLGGDKPIQEFVKLGGDSVEHAYHMEEETAYLMKERGTFLVPTLSVTNCHNYLVGHGSPEFQVRKLDETGEAHSQSIGNAIKAGVTICTGTDLLPSDPIDGTNATVREMELLVKAGLTPMQAIKAATSNSAKLTDTIGFTGTLEAEKEGDFIAVKGKPDQDIHDMRNLELVAKGCRLVWSTVPGLKIRRYNITVPGMNVAGGTYMKW